MRLNMHRTAFTVAGALVVCGVVGMAAQQPQPFSAARQAVRVLPGTRSSAFTTIQGSALNSTNGILADTPVRLRDVRFGRIVDTTMSDKAGLFTFRGVDPGSYVVELIGKDQTILAASQVLNIDSGTAVSAIVKLPFRVPPFGGLLGHSAASAVAVASAAAASGVLARAVTTCKSDPCGS
jgi:hypothetical protein